MANARVGKTTLIQKALKSSSYRTVYFLSARKVQCKTTSAGLCRNWSEQNPTCAIEFWYFTGCVRVSERPSEKIVVVIDEHPYLKAMNDSATVDSIFQNIIDNRLVNIELILSGPTSV